MKDETKPLQDHATTMVVTVDLSKVSNLEALKTVLSETLFQHTHDESSFTIAMVGNEKKNRKSVDPTSEGLSRNIVLHLLR